MRLMKKKVIYLLYLIAGLALIHFFCIRRTDLAEAISQSLYSGTRLPLFLLAIFFMGLAFYTVVKKKADRRLGYISVFACIILGVVLANDGDNSIKDCLNAANKTEITVVESQIFSGNTEMVPAYYCKGKTIHLDEKTVIKNCTIKESEIRENYSGIKVPDECENFLLSLEICPLSSQHRELMYWAFGEEWVNEDECYYITCQDNDYVVPASIYNSLIDDSYDKAATPEYLQPDLMYQLPITFMDIYSVDNQIMARQIVLLTGYFLLGLLFCLAFVNKTGQEVSASLLAFPMGTAIAVCVSYFELSVALFYNIASVLTGCILVLVVTYLIRIKRKAFSIKNLDLDKLILSFVVAVLVITFVVVRRNCYLSFDSYENILWGFGMSVNPAFFKQELEEIASYGLYSCVINSHGFMLGGDMVYGFTTIMGILAVAISGYFMFGMAKKYPSKIKGLEYILVFGVLMVLVLASDFRLHLFYMMNTMPVAVYFVIALGGMLYAMEMDCLKDYFPYILISYMIISFTRVEGAIYVVFVLSAFLANSSMNKYIRQLSSSLFVWSILWNVVQFIYIGSNEETYFWSPKKAIVIIFGFVALIVVNILLSKDNKFIDFICDRYLQIWIVAVALATALASLIKADLASENAITYLLHFCANRGFWCMVLTLLPFFIFEKEKDSAGRLYVNIVLGYLLLLFALFLFRNNTLENLQLTRSFGDSARRCIFQLMPTVAFMLGSQLIRWGHADE